MSDKTVDDVMALAIEFANRIASGYGDERTQAREALREAIVALAAERDRAVMRANSYQMSFEEMCEFRNDAAEERDEAQEDSLKWAAQCGSFHQECDALKARVVELERAIDGALNSKVTGYGGPADHANNCHARFSCWPPADCTCFIKELRACIVRTIKEKP